MLEKEYELAQMPVTISDSTLDDPFDDMDDIYIPNISTSYRAKEKEDTILTYYGQMVFGKRNPEMAESVQAGLSDYVRANFPNATVLKKASQLYNCHSYAWNLSEHGDTICWINANRTSENDNIKTYWSNDYFFQSL